ncbi:hypothetical protein SETIT_4G208200v2 [Setaria italica]|uniref:Uncharacterized protein n=1 Tax=Setaria italica TaxID=4555 RepID=A0A368QYA5_SETIT|nr:hypothetical protein SETIT_4G208200v2 [Setaria italica]
MTGDWSSMAPLFRVQALKRHRYPSICIPIRHCTVQTRMVEVLAGTASPAASRALASAAAPAARCGAGLRRAGRCSDGRSGAAGGRGLTDGRVWGGAPVGGTALRQAACWQTRPRRWPGGRVRGASTGGWCSDGWSGTAGGRGLTGGQDGARAGGARGPPTKRDGAPAGGAVLRQVRGGGPTGGARRGCGERGAAMAAREEAVKK